MTILSVNRCSVTYTHRKSLFTLQRSTVVHEVDLQLDAGKTLALVGESGCGKTTLARAIIGLLPIESGEIIFDGRELRDWLRHDRKAYASRVQMVFQDPNESLNARHTVRRTLEEPFLIHTRLTRQERHQKVMRLLDIVGLPASSIDRYPHEFSGGQRQRIGIARAIALEPKMLICDEPVSALDVSIQAQIVNLLLDLQKEFAMSYLMIAHGLPLVQHMADRIAVMQNGRIVEEGPARRVYDSPQHPYTKALISAVPKIP